MTERAAVYCRVSTEDQADEGTSLETQRIDGLALAKRLSLDVPTDFVISEVMSGAKFDERSGIQRIRELIQRKAIQVVIAQKVDRISRTPMHFYSIYDLAQRHGVRFEWTDQTFANSPDGQMLLGLMVVFAQRELEMIRERTQSGVKARVERDKKPIPGVRAPYGYRWIDEKKTRLEQDPETASLWKEVLVSLSSGTSANSIAKRLNAQGIPTPSKKPGAKWTASNIAKMATHPAYYGSWAVWRRSKDDHREQTILDDVVTEPLVAFSTWAAIQDRLGLNKLESKRNNAKPFEALLRAGIARCGYCGNAAQAANVKIKNGQHVRCYVCNKSNASRYGCKSFYLRCDELDREVWDFVRLLLNDPDLVEQQLRSKHDGEVQAADLTPLRRHIEDLGKRQQRLIEEISLEDEGSMRRVLKDKLAELIQQQESTQHDLDALESEESVKRHHRETLKSMLEVMQRFNERLENDVPYDIKRAALTMLDVRVDLFNRSDSAGRWKLSYSVLGKDNELRKGCSQSYPQRWDSEKLLLGRVSLTLSDIRAMRQV